MKRSPRGFTLIEVMLAMILLATMLTVVALTLGKLARADQRSRDRIDEHRVLRRLVIQLRQDVHLATACEISPAPLPPANDAPSANDAPPAEAESTAEAETPATAKPDEDHATPQQTLILLRSDGRTIRFERIDHGFVRTVLHDGKPEHHESFVWHHPISATWTKDTSQQTPQAVLTVTLAGRPQRDVQRHVVRATLLNLPTNHQE